MLGFISDRHKELQGSQMACAISHHAAAPGVRAVRALPRLVFNHNEVSNIPPKNAPTAGTQEEGELEPLVAYQVQGIW